MPKPRFTKKRIEQLRNASNELSKQRKVPYEDARDLALFALDEMERIRDVYQSRLMNIATATADAAAFPEREGGKHGK